MALLNNGLGGWGETLLLGAGVAIAAPIVLPVVEAVVRPVAKLAIKGGLFAADTVREFITEGGEQVSDLVAEARAEYQASSDA
jgi:hypothetical protein